MIIFHEGLPRAGKSYEAMVERIVPALAKGRAVVAYVEGLNHEKIAELAGIDVDKCRELLTALTREQLQSGEGKTLVDHLPDLAKDNALVVLDETQNFWGIKHNMRDGMTKFITEHGHRGIDIVLMGQDIRDCHALWRRRVEMKLCFLKLNGLGVGSRYSVTTYRHLGGDKWSKLGTTSRKYDPKYFGSYASFVSDDTNTDVYTDKRAQVWNHAGIKYGMPALLCAAIAGGVYVYRFFNPPKDEKPAVLAQPQPQQPPLTAAPAARPGPVAAPIATAPPASAPAPKADERSPQERRFASLSDKYRIRLAGLIMAQGRAQGVVEWLDGGTRVIERLSLDTLRDLGVAVLVTGDVVRLALGEWTELATMWPVEGDLRVSEAVQDRIRGRPAGGEPASPQQGATEAVSFSGPSPGRPFSQGSREPAGPLEVQQRQPRVPPGSPWAAPR